MNRILLGFCCIVLLVRCGTDAETEECVPPPANATAVDFVFQDLRDSIAAIENEQQLIKFFSSHKVFRDYSLRRNEYPHDSAYLNAMVFRFTNPAIDTLVMQTKKVFGNLTDLKSQFQEAFSNIKAYYPEFVPPKVEVVITGLDSDIFVSDSLIVVSVDFYLGKGAKYRPRFYEYILRKYEPEDIVPSAMLLYGINEKLNKTNLQDRTVLADMISYGKAFYFAKHVLPCVPDSVFLWYTAEEIDGARKNEDLIWARFVQDKILFSTNMVDKRNYLEERPFTIQVGEKCPGRIAQWVGWRIVKQYMEQHPEISLPQLMQMNDAQEIFKESNYKPRRR